jgi:hypothetical protein
MISDQRRLELQQAELLNLEIWADHSFSMLARRKDRALFRASLLRTRL